MGCTCLCLQFISGLGLLFRLYLYSPILVGRIDCYVMMSDLECEL